MTVGAMVLGLKSIQEGFCYIVAQCIGAVVGFGLLKVCTTDKSNPNTQV